MHAWGRLFVFGALVAGACTPLNLGPTPTSAPSTAPTEAPPSTSVPTQVPSTPSGNAVVVFVQDGNLLVWEEATGQTKTIFDGGDVRGRF